MVGELGSSAACAAGDASDKVILTRGCDPIMAERAGKMLPPLLGNVQMIAATDDVHFFELLASRKFDVVAFAPGACRFSAAKQTIPGGSLATKTWTLVEYKAKVREHQGEDVPVVETTAEAEMVPLLRDALGLP